MRPRRTPLADVPAEIITGLVGVVALCIGVFAARAMLRTGNGNIGFVVAGFTLLALKSGLKVWRLQAGADTAAWEIAFSLMDLVAMLMIAFPLVRRARRPTA